MDMAFWRTVALAAGAACAGACTSSNVPDAPDAGTPACNHAGDEDEDTFRAYREDEKNACEAAQVARCELACNLDDSTCLEAHLPTCAFTSCDQRTLAEVRESALEWWCFKATVFCREGYTNQGPLCSLTEQS